MRRLLPAAVFAAFIVGSGCFWRHSSEGAEFLLVVVRPVCAAILITVLWNRWSILRKLVVATAAVAAIEVVAAISYGLTAGWRYLLEDPETQLFLMAYLGTSVAVALCVVLLLWGAQGLARRG